MLIAHIDPQCRPPSPSQPYIQVPPSTQHASNRTKPTFLGAHNNGESAGEVQHQCGMVAMRLMIAGMGLPVFVVPLGK
jgi:hypothetical protein